MIHLLPDVVNIKQKEEGEKIKWHTPLNTCTSAHYDRRTHMRVSTDTHLEEYAHARAHTTLIEQAGTWVLTQGPRNPS